MREDDVPEHGVHTYADIHRRLDRLDDRLKEVEVAIARGARFPAWGGTVLVAMVLQLGASVYWGGQLTQKVDSLPSLKAQCDDCERKIADVRAVQQVVIQRLSEVEKTAAGGTDDRWRKRDDEARMAEAQRYMDTRFAALEHRVEQQEVRSVERDRWWQRIWGSGIFKGATP